jgi:hypothetical protein
MSDLRSISNVFPRFYAILPPAGPADMSLSQADSPVERSFLSDLIIFYAFDLGDWFELVSNSAREKMEISEEDLHAASLKNLRALNLEILAHRGDRYIMLTAGGNFEATLLLLPEVWESVSEMVQGNIIAVTPARDLLLFTGDSDLENLAELRRKTSQSIEKADKPLSRNFFQRNGSAWLKYQGFAE